jgi:ankyrin repeat protein
MRLHSAARHGSAETLKALLDAGAEPTITDQNGETPLHIAFRHQGLLRLAELLLDAGSDISAQNSDGRTPLYLATMEPWRRPQVIKLLQKAGIDVTAHLQAWQTHDLITGQKTQPAVWPTYFKKKRI